MTGLATRMQASRTSLSLIAECAQESASDVRWTGTTPNSWFNQKTRLALWQDDLEMLEIELLREDQSFEKAITAADIHSILEDLECEIAEALAIVTAVRAPLESLDRHVASIEGLQEDIGVARPEDFYEMRESLTAIEEVIDSLFGATNAHFQWLAFLRVSKPAVRLRPEGLVSRGSSNERHVAPELIGGHNNELSSRGDVAPPLTRSHDASEADNDTIKWDISETPASDHFSSHSSTAARAAKPNSTWEVLQSSTAAQASSITNRVLQNYADPRVMDKAPERSDDISQRSITAPVDTRSRNLTQFIGRPQTPDAVTRVRWFKDPNRNNSRYYIDPDTFEYVYENGSRIPRSAPRTQRPVTPVTHSHDASKADVDTTMRNTFEKSQPITSMSAGSGGYQWAWFPARQLCYRTDQVAGEYVFSDESRLPSATTASKSPQQSNARPSSS
ncbi:hypothetical protein Slin15195_G061500 [Septoria linicola]|uniref:Uncharacterized protein n=1 Tax=Septoria linicola TaxID=215465 RepID=A0A9Q9EIJ2_9PEZI|nr:hypothetical protein Slin14017_G077300 [Septoria linicola]USW52831.1 hypothetical protein Slin15195_G061500 [Septoria linicola]